MPGPSLPVPLVVFTNLDDMLLRSDSAEAVRPALGLLAANRVPLVIASSRTGHEIELLQERLNLRHPFIAESGAALFIPLDYFEEAPPRCTTRSGYHVAEVGVRYRDVVATLHRLARQLHVGIESFSQMTVEEVGKACSLSLLQARLAKLRDHSEPFRFTDATPKARARLIHALHSAGFECFHDGRFHHAVPRSDIGAHVRLLRACYAAASDRAAVSDRSVTSDRAVTIGLGDRIEDLPMLQEVDIPVVVQGQAGRTGVELFSALPQAMLTRACGPDGWAEAVTILVQRFRTAMEPSAVSADRPAA